MYSEARHIFLGHYISIWDSHNAAAIFETCIEGPLIKGRTCKLVTHSVALAAADAEFLLVLAKGAVVAAGGMSDIPASCRTLRDLPQSSRVNKESEENVNPLQCNRER